MTWHTRPMAAFDTETTGLDIDADRIVTAALWRIDPGNGAKASTDWLADPGVPIPEQAAAMHGVTTEHARAHGQSAAKVIGEIAHALADAAAEGVPVVVFNAAYDLSLLDRELRRHHQPTQFLASLRVIDPMVMDKQADPYRRGKRRLTDVCTHHGVPLSADDAHGSSADALAAARLAWRLGSIHPHFAALDADTLHTRQREWRATQAASLQDHLRRTKDPEAVVNGDWPLIPAP